MLLQCILACLFFLLLLLLCIFCKKFLVCIFIFVTFLFFLLGNYLQFNAITSSNGSSNKSVLILPLCSQLPLNEKHTIY